MAGSILASPSGKPTSPVARPALRGSETWQRFRRHRLAMTGAFILGLMCLGVIFGPLLWPVAINDIDFAATLQGPSLGHPFGTDDLGQDLLARMIYGGRISLAVGFAAMIIATLVGVVVGAVAGMSRGIANSFLTWLPTSSCRCRNCRSCFSSSTSSVTGSRLCLA